MKQHGRQCLILLLLLVFMGCSESSDNPHLQPTQNGGSGGTGFSQSTNSGTASERDADYFGATNESTAAVGMNDEAGTVVEDDTCEASITETDKDGNPLVHVLDANNYRYQSSLTIQTIRVKSLSNLVFDWSEVTQDLRGRDLDPLLDVDQMRVVLFKGVKEDELVQLMSNDSDLIRYVYGAVYVDTQNAITSTNLLDLHPPVGDLPDEVLLSYVDTDVYSPQEYSYAVMLAKGGVLSSGFLLIAFIRPDPNETNTRVKFTNDSTKLDYTVDLTSLQKIRLPAGVSNITIKWKDNTLITKTANGNDFSPTAITDVMIGHYPNATSSDLESQFLNIDGIAESIWSKFLDAGTGISLSDLQNEKGEPFPGIDPQGTWLFVLRCSSCTSPVPWFLTVLQPCPQ